MYCVSHFHHLLQCVLWKSRTVHQKALPLPWQILEGLNQNSQVFQSGMSLNQNSQVFQSGIMFWIQTIKYFCQAAGIAHPKNVMRSMFESSFFVLLHLNFFLRLMWEAWLSVLGNGTTTHMWQQSSLYCMQADCQETSKVVIHNVSDLTVCFELSENAVWR